MIITLVIISTIACIFAATLLTEKSWTSAAYHTLMAAFSGFMFAAWSYFLFHGGF